MRVITGSARGKRLKELPGLDTRPTTDRVKEGLFNIIQFDIEGRRVLDLFAGTGQLGVECLSRGAAFCDFVDSAPAARKIVKDNVAACGLTGRAAFHQKDFSAFLATARGRYDLVFLDPPYASGNLERALDQITAIDIVTGNGIIVCESPAEYAPPGVTIAVIPVPWEEAPRFGIMNTDDTGRIMEFEEKPAEPKSNLASMGIYIFNWKLLREMLIADKDVEGSSHDFGKDIIPGLLNNNKILCAWRFEGYWKDVGTIDSLWEANMDLLDKDNALDLSDPTWKIYTEDPTTLPHYISAEADVKNAFINQGCVVEGEVKNSVLFTGVKVGVGAKIIDSVLMPGVVVEAGASVTRALVADNVRISANATVGSADSEHIELVAKNVKEVE